MSTTKIFTEGLYDIRLASVEVIDNHQLPQKSGGKIIGYTSVRAFVANLTLFGEIPKGRLSEGHETGDAPTFTVWSFEGSKVQLRPGEMADFLKGKGQMGWGAFKALLIKQFAWNMCTGEKFKAGVESLRGKLTVMDATEQWPARNILNAVYSPSADFSDAFKDDTEDMSDAFKDEAETAAADEGGTTEEGASGTTGTGSEASTGAGSTATPAKPASTPAKPARR